MNKDLHIIFFGTPAFVIPVLEALAKNFQVAGVVTAPDKPVGRKQTLTPSPVKNWALQHNIPVFTPEKLDQTFSSELRNTNSELFIVAAYGKIIPQFILDIPKHGALNIHYSLLPKYRGASPIQCAILNGDKISGTSIIKMDAKLDHGPIISTKEIRLSESDTFASLNTKMTDETIPLLLKTIPDFTSNKVNPIAQDDTKASYCNLVKKEDGYIDINNPPPPEQLDRIIRAYYPWPAAWTKWNGKIVKILPEGNLQMEGKRPMKLIDFLHGYPDFPIKN